MYDMISARARRREVGGEATARTPREGQRAGIYDRPCPALEPFRGRRRLKGIVLSEALEMRYERPHPQFISADFAASGRPGAAIIDYHRYERITYEMQLKGEPRFASAISPAGELDAKGLPAAPGEYGAVQGLGIDAEVSHGSLS